MGAKVLTPKLTTSRRQQADSECSNASSNSSEFSDESSQSGNCCICQSCCKPFQTYSELKAYSASEANYEKDNVLKVFKMGNDDIQDQISLDGTDRKDYGKKTILLGGTDGKNNGHAVGHDADTESVEAKVHEDSQRSRVHSESGTSTSSGFTKSDACSKQVDLKSYEKTPSSNDKLNSSSPLNSESIDRNISNIAEDMTELTKSNTSTATLKHQDITSVRDNSQLSHHSSDTTKRLSFHGKITII
ncbi:unnamed protein product [Anisakis simplex]|uniref:Dentin sialophosphoprotein-like n=1 Tax=Anisakis simplex TaxID=6269 RepID=A0A0M3K5M5_ANISI|nr:unnamed protein product [Anisakis simplex]